MTSNENVIEIENVRKAFGNQVVLEEVNLSVERGKTLVIVGASGQGKSVIIKHMLGLMQPSSGSVKAFGKDFKKMDTAELNHVRKKFGVLFQNGALLDSLTVFDNVALPIRERTDHGAAKVREIVRDRLNMMDLDGVDEKYPAQLSGGMRKRVALARALTLDPEVVFFDEPTTGLDVHKSNEIYRLFHRTREQLGYTAVIVSHDAPKIFKLADRVALLAEGRVQEVLAPEKFQLSDNEQVKSFVHTTMGSPYSSEREEEFHQS